MDNNQYVDTYKYNTSTKLYDVTLKNGKVLNGMHRIFNRTSLLYAPENGYFLISKDNYIFLYGNNPEEELNNLYKYSTYALKNNLTNKQLLDLSLDPVEKSKLLIINKSNDFCIYLALEKDPDEKLEQLRMNKEFSKYDCLVREYIDTGRIDNTLKTPTSSLVDIFKKYVSNEEEKKPLEVTCNNVNNNIEINEYNRYYIYGLTFLNGILFIIAVALILILFDDNRKKKTIEI